MIDKQTAPYAALLLRISLGILFLAHAWLKLFVLTPAGTIRFFQSIDLPGPLAYIAIGIELVAGIALIFGIWSRVFALLALPDLLGAIATVHIHAGFFFTHPNGGWEYPAFRVVALLVLALLGDGAYALCPFMPLRQRRNRLL